MLAKTPETTGKKPQARSRITNGSSLGVGDGRTKWARRLKDLIDRYSADIIEPNETLSEATRSLIRRAAVLTLELERAEEGFAGKDEVDAKDLESYQTSVNSLRRLLETLRINPFALSEADRNVL